MEQIQQLKNSVTEIEPITSTLGEQDSPQKNKKNWVLPAIILLVIGFIGSVGFTVYKVYRNTQVTENLNESDENKIEVYYDENSEYSEDVDYNQVIEDGEELEVDSTADLPTPPVGMNWIYCSNIEAYLLSPNGWFQKEESTSSAEACFISRESIEYGGEFEAGLSVNLIRDVKEKTSKSNLEYAKSFIDKLAEEFDSSVESGGDGVHFEGFSTGVSSKDSSGNIINAYYLALASMDTDKLYIFWYEGPSDEWDILWPLGRDMLLNLALESE